MRFLALDPSIHNIGWAMFDSKATTIQMAWSGGTIKIDEPNIQRVCTECVTQMYLLNLRHFECLVTEMPTFFTSERGQVAARNNYTIDLAAISFYVAGYFRLRPSRHFPITAATWKGNITKEITARRFYRTLGSKISYEKISEHQIDAQMMLRWFLLTYVVKGRLSSLCNPAPDWQLLLAT